MSTDEIIAIPGEPAYYATTPRFYPNLGSVAEDGLQHRQYPHAGSQAGQSEPSPGQPSPRSERGNDEQHKRNDDQQ